MAELQLPVPEAPEVQRLNGRAIVLLDEYAELRMQAALLCDRYESACVIHGVSPQLAHTDPLARVLTPETLRAFRKLYCDIDSERNDILREMNRVIAELRLIVQQQQRQ